MTGEPVHTTSKKRMAPELMFSSEHVPQLSVTDLKMKWSLCFAFSYVQPVTQCYKGRTVGEAPPSIQSPRKYGQFMHSY